MRSASRRSGLDGRKIGLLVLGACTVWLVIQNTLLFMAMMWGDPAVVSRLAMVVMKAGALVTAKFWASPAAAALVAAVLLLLVMRARPTDSTRTEVRHG